MPRARCMFLIFLLLQGWTVQGQKHDIESLEKALLNAVPAYTLADTFHVDLLNELAFALRNTDVARAAATAKQARELAEQIGDAKGMARAAGYQGLMAYRQGRYDFAILYHLQSLKVADSIGASQLVAFRYNDLANVYLDKGDLERALLYNSLSLAIKEKIQDKEGMAASYRNLGMIHLRQNHSDSAQYYLNISEQLAREIGDNRILGYVYMYQGELQAHIGNIAEAIRLLTKSSKLSREISNLYGLAESMNSLADAYLTGGMIQEAKGTYEQALAIAHNIKIRLEVQRAFEGLALVHEKQQQFAEALYYFRQYTLVKDSIFTEKNEEMIAFLDAQFQHTLQQSQINLLTKEKAVESRKAQTERRYNYALTALAFIIATALVVITMNMMVKRRLNKDLLKKQAEITSQAQELQKLNAFKDQLFYMIAHDLRSPMSTLKNAIELLKPELLRGEELEMIKKELHRQFSVNDEILQNMLTWARSQMQGEETLPVTVSLSDVVAQTFEFLMKIANDKGIGLHWEFDTNLKVRVDTDHLAAILRNLVANTIKFTPPGGEVGIKAVAKDEQIEIAVKDNGIGMSEEQIQKLLAGEKISTPGTAGEKGTGFGMIMVKDLIRKNGGSLHIESHQNQGSIVYVTLPVPETDYLMLNRE